jgi:hypothetical protein
MKNKNKKCKKEIEKGKIHTCRKDVTNKKGKMSKENRKKNM